MRAREFLLEYKRDITAKKLGDKLLARNKSADMTKLNTPEEILSQLETGDPTKNKQYTLWITNRYIAGDFFLEDLEIVRRYLEKFIEAKSKRLLNNTDIGQYKLSTLKSEINRIYKVNNSAGGLQGALYPKIPGTKVLYNGPEGQFAVMSTLEGSMQHNRQVGEFAEWCTADSRAPSHYQSHASEGPLYVFVDPQGNKYQLHFETNQFKDKNDNELGLDAERKIVSLPFIWKNIDWDKAIYANSEKAFLLMPKELLNSMYSEKAEYYFWFNKVKDDISEIVNVPEKIQKDILNYFSFEDVYNRYTRKRNIIDAPNIIWEFIQENYGIADFLLESDPDEGFDIAINLMQRGFNINLLPYEMQENDEIKLEFFKYNTREFANAVLSNKINYDIYQWMELTYENWDTFEFVPSEIFASEEFQKYLIKIALEQENMPLDEYYKSGCDSWWEYIGGNNSYWSADLIKILLTRGTEHEVYTFCYKSAEEIEKQPKKIQNELWKKFVYELIFVNDIIEYVPEEYQSEELCLVAVKENGESLEYVPEELKTPEVCLAAVKQNIDALEWVPEEIRDEIEKKAGL